MQYTTARTDDVALVVLTPSHWSKSLDFTRLDKSYDRAHLVSVRRMPQGGSAQQNYRLTDGKSGS